MLLRLLCDGRFANGAVIMIVMCLCTMARGHYTPQWAVHITGGIQQAERVAQEHGFILLGEIMPDYYHFLGKSIQRRSIEPHHNHQARLDGDGRVHWAQQQRARSRQKRDLLVLKNPRPAIISPTIINTNPPLNDQRWPQMWYLNRGGGLDMNVMPAWAEGVTGKGVVVTILDDGLEKDHPDLMKNYDPLASYDVNSHDEDPMPRYDMIDSNRHGTRCAGEVAATANNTICAVGVAFGASVGGVRMLDGDVTDAVEARSLSLNPQHIDIYSASWGPDDDGKTVDGPGELAQRAFIEGVTKGRNGKGSIFVWASGNGGRDHDNCNCDGYTNSIWTLSISSATETGHVPWYSEACSSTLATTYSSGSLNEKQVITTDLHHSCTSSHTGTSASAPLAAGICALALEANPNLTWRDMQHIVVRTAKPANLNAPDWQVNGVGRNVSHSFGYGLMDATAMVHLARKWKTVPEQQKCEISAQISDPTIPPKSRKKFSLVVKECAGVNYLEHVQAKITLSTLRRGDLEINLTSPAGTKSTLLAHRLHDVSRQGFVSWPFMSVHTWGERPFGEWKLEIHNEGRTLNRASLQQWSLIFYGTTVAVFKSDKNYALPNILDSLPSNNNTQSKHIKGKGNKNPAITNYMLVSKKVKNKNKNQKNGKTTVKPDTILKGISKPKIYKPNVDATTETPPKFNRYRANQKKNQKSSKNPTTTVFPNFKIPPIFQQYPKAQHIYPALFPHIKSGNIESPSRQGSSQFFAGTLISSTNARLGQKNSEISRDTESAHRKGKKYTHESHESKNVESSTTLTPFVPKNSKALQEKATEITTVSIAPASELSEWTLILHGTTILPGENTKPSLEDLDGTAPSEIGLQNNDFEHNSLIPSNDQWREGPQVRDELSHVDVNQASDQFSSSSACTLSQGNICIECTARMYLFNGKCLEACPPQTYSVSQESKRTQPLTMFSFGSNHRTHNVCEACHYSCFYCSGPFDFQCEKCFEDAVLSVVSNSETFCYPIAMATNMNNRIWFFQTYVLLLVVIFILFTIGLIFLIICIYTKWKNSKMDSKQAYTPVSLSEVQQKHTTDDQQEDSSDSE